VSSSQNSLWLVKIERAGEHLGSLRQEVKAMKATGDLRVEVAPWSERAPSA
jgi:hypothetical protein